MVLFSTILSFFVVALLVQAEVYLSFSSVIPADGSDLAQFVTRPDLRPPIYDVLIHDPDLLSPGYIFVAPYERVRPELRTKKFIPAQVGPHIYDSNGDLIWSGAQSFRNRNTYSFRPMTHELASDLAFNWGIVQENIDFSTGAGLVMNTSYDIISHVLPSHGYAEHDMHEFNVNPDGKTALRITTVPLYTDVSHLSRKLKSLWLNNEGFQEIDIETGRVIFDWWALDYLNLEHSWPGFPAFTTSVDKPWDPFHINSVDKDHSTGNYMVSVRHYDAVLLISAKDGSIIWQMGGTETTIQLTSTFSESHQFENYSFVGQHDARFHNCDSVLSVPADCFSGHQRNKDVTIISLFDNAARLPEPNVTSRSLLIAIDDSTRTATVLQQHFRPDGGLSYQRGNVQYLPSGNVFNGWSIQGYISEHVPLPNGQSKCIMEAAFRSPRLGVYRSYKFDNFIGWSKEKIAFKHFVYGPKNAKMDHNKAVHVFYVSWNGATEVETWSFYRSSRSKTSHDQPPAKDKFKCVGSSPRTGFETSFTAGGWSEWAWVEALDINGNIIGSSAKIRVVKPQSWELENQITNEEESSSRSPAHPKRKSKHDASREKHKTSAQPGKGNTLNIHDLDPVSARELGAGLVRVLYCFASFVAAAALTVLRRKIKRSIQFARPPLNLKTSNSRNSGFR